MDWHNNKPTKDRIARVASNNELVEGVVNFPMSSDAGAPTSSSCDPTAALRLVSETAEAIKCAENHAADMMAQAQSLAGTAAEKVRLTLARIERAETAKHEAETDLANCRAEIEKLRSDLKQAEARIADTADELAAVKQHASKTENRANDAEAALESVMNAIRTQLPRNNKVVARKHAVTA
jgi:chromosome segregation ATPase